MATLPIESLDTPPPTTTDGEDVPQELANEKDLLAGREDLQKAVKALCKHFLGLDKWVRRQEVIEARRQRFYWRNDQYIYWKNDTVGFIPAIGGQSLGSDESTIEVPRYTDVYNIYTPYGESLLSTLIQNAPGVNWQPVDPSQAKDITASKTAEKYQQKIETDNDRKSIQSDVARLFFTDGRTILEVNRADNVEKIYAYGVLESKVCPITANCLDELVSLTLSCEVDMYKAKGDNPNYADKIKEGMSTLGESAYERIARLGVLQGTRLLMQAGDAFAHMVTCHACYLRTCTFDKIEEEYRDEIKAIFPDGMRACFCGDQYVGSENVNMNDRVTIGFPGPGDGMSRPSMGKRVVPLQDVFNDELNLWHEAHDYCVPTLFMYSETGDIESVREQISQPGNVVPFSALPPGASSAESAFYAAVLDSIPATLPQFIEFIQGPLAQFISGAFPALFGGDTGDNDTAKGISIQRDQAMGRMGIPWGSLQQLFAGAYTNCLISVVEHADDSENFSYSVKTKTGGIVVEELSISDLKNGAAVCKADTDASFPESTNAKRQTYQMLMAASERNPILAQVMANPNNQELGHEVIGLPDLIVPGAESRNKQLIEIEQLLAESPVPPSMQEATQAAMQNPQILQQLAQWEKQNQAAQASGQPATPIPVIPGLTQPSVPIDNDFDDHEIELQEVKDWLNSEDRRKEEQKGNTQGIMNVRLHGLAHKNAAAMAAMAAMMVPPGPGSPGAGTPPSPTGGPSGPGPKQAAPVLAGAAAQR